MTYSWYAKNHGKDLIYVNRLRIAEKLGLHRTCCNSAAMYAYLMEAELGIILQ